MTKILYISSLCSDKLLQYIYDTAIQKPEQAAQKFHRLLTQGFALNTKQCSIQTLSSIPVTPLNHKKKLWARSSELSNGVKFRYVPMLNIPYVKNFGVFFYTFFKIVLWSWFRMGRKKMIVSDVLNFTIAFASYLACKISFTKNITIVTDLPHNILHAETGNKSMGAKIYDRLTKKMLYGFDGYVLLTEQMNAVVNPKKKPYMIMEGLVDIEMEGLKNSIENKAKEKILIYAGGLYEKYGVKMLVDSFMKLSDVDARLHLYGNGEMVDDMEKYMNLDSRISYKGMVPNKQVVLDQLSATLLINPRPSNEEFTKFSFPSKNMEYMVSGTPMLSNKLPGMPKEYWQYVFLNENESVEGLHNTLTSILSKTNTQLHNYGESAKNFVLEEKNNKKQAARLLKFYEDIAS